MIGFPKTLTDFSQTQYFYKELQKPFEKHVQFYLQNQDFTKEKKETWKYFPFQKVLNRNFVFEPSSSSKDETEAQIPSSLFISVRNGQVFPSFKLTKRYFRLFLAGFFAK